MTGNLAIRQKLTFRFSEHLSNHLILLVFLTGGIGEYWKLTVWTLFYWPELIVDAITYSVYGYHFRMIYGLKTEIAKRLLNVGMM